MDLEISGSRAFVSGSTQGIGYAVARTLAAEGAAVIINGRHAARVDEAVARLRADAPGSKVEGLAADFSDEGEVRRLLGELDDIDILVNNVGLFGLASFDEITDEDWHRYLDVNLMSGVRLSRHVLGGMLARNRGRIIFVSSESGVNVPGDMIHYGVTKAAVMALSNGLAKLTKGTSVTVNAILGGPTYSEGVAAAVNTVAQLQAMDPSDMKAAVIAGNQTSLLQRFIEPEEIANLVAYLASPRSAASNGAALRADGGVLTTLV